MLPQHLNKRPRLLRSLALVHRSASPVQYFEPSIIRQLRQETQLRQSIEAWIHTKSVPLWLQPKVSLKDGVCIGSEALLRVWENPRATRYVSPPQVFSIAARHHFLESLEWATVETIIAYIEQMPPELAELSFSLNISSHTLMKPNFGERICELLANKGVPTRRLVLEIIETDRLLKEDAVLKENMALITKAGIGLSLDDFGTGYSTISTLSTFPFQELKLDYSMVSTMDDPRVRSAISLSVEGARRYDATVVAEGIETKKQLRQLREIGIEFGQGYLFGKAMPLQDFIRYAKENITT